MARLSHKDEVNKLLIEIEQKDSKLKKNEQTLMELRNLNDNLKSKILNLEEKIEEKSQECKDLETERKKETKELSNRIMRLQKQIINGNDKQKELQEQLDHENKMFEKQMEQMRLRMENMQSTQFQKHNSGEGDICDKLKTELKEVKSELEDAKIRLSKPMGQKLTDNNPNVADLSDRNRPTKLAERYTDLYDNQWTDAFEIINNGDEKKTIMTLRQILQESMSFCEAESTKQMKRLMEVLMLSGVECDVPRLVKKNLKDSRKTTAEASGKHLFKIFLKYLNRPGSSYADIADRIEKYIEECFQTCWLMCVLDPPVVLGKDLEEGVLFNTNVFKAYTRSGGVVDYVVWPALFLHEGGAMLCNGVAQGH